MEWTRPPERGYFRFLRTMHVHACTNKGGSVKEITMIGLDLAKNIIQLHAVDKTGKAVMRKPLKRNKLLPFLSLLPPCLIVMETCSGAHFWARSIKALGHEPKLISPQFVKPFVKTNKNDANDAEAICEAASRPSMRFVPIKTPEQLDIQAVHRIRKGLVRRRTSVVNEIRGHLAEYGIVLAKGISRVREEFPHILENLENGLTELARDYLSDLYSDIIELDEKIEKKNRILIEYARQNEPCQRLMTIPGVGVITATILAAVAGDGRDFKNGRHFAAWLGLVPRQRSSGGHDRLLGISKRGDSYMRTQLVQGAHNLVRRKTSPWIATLAERRGYARACVAQANKTARIAWAVLRHNCEYQPMSLTQ